MPLEFNARAKAFFERPLSGLERAVGLLRPVLGRELFRFCFPATNARLVFHERRREGR